MVIICLSTASRLQRPSNNTRKLLKKDGVSYFIFDKNMKCARLHLQERVKPRIKPEWVMSNERPKRFCQKRMVNPDHEEDPRWMNVYERFHCNENFEQIDYNETINSDHDNLIEDLFLSVQNLKFEGDDQPTKRSRTSFKYKAKGDGINHRMFVKETVTDQTQIEEDRSSQLTCYFDDYVKYILNNDRSRPGSNKSSLFLYGLANKFKENKAIQVDSKSAVRENPKQRKAGCKIKNTKREIKRNIQEDDSKNEQTTSNIDDAKIVFHKSGKRKSLTISRAPSPETVQIIRVDVVCNYSTSSLSDYEETKQPEEDIVNSTSRKDSTDSKNSRLGNRYLLTKTIKSLDQNVSGGAKVTLLCKTYKLSDRTKSFHKKNNKTKLEGKNCNKIKNKLTK